MLVVVPLVRGRTLRLTNRRLEAAIPLLMTELKADKSVLPAEFVMSTQRPETNVEQQDQEPPTSLWNAAKRAMRSTTAQDRCLRDQLHATEEELAVKATAMREAERA